MLIVLLALCSAAAAHRYVYVYAPSNVIVARVRRERPSMRHVVVMLMGASVLMLGAASLSDAVANGAPG